MVILAWPHIGITECQCLCCALLLHEESLEDVTRAQLASFKIFCVRTVVQERQFEAICVRLLNAKRHITNAKNQLLSLKKDKPKIYLLLLIGTFATMAWLGSLIDNLLLTYLIVVGFALVPGLRKRGILQRLVSKVTEVIGGLKRGQEKVGKTKTN